MRKEGTPPEWVLSGLELFEEGVAFRGRDVWHEEGHVRTKGPVAEPNMEKQKITGLEYAG